jgi:DNA-binding HxlR family transcriptional regulator
MQAGSAEAEWREDCAPRRVLALFATKWTSMVLHTLHARHGGACRTASLQRSLPGVSRKMLIQTLRQMEDAGLLTRHARAVVPPTVEYRLSPLGVRFVEPVELLYDWGRRNADALDALGSRPSARRASGQVKRQPPFTSSVAPTK